MLMLIKAYSPASSTTRTFVPAMSELPQGTGKAADGAARELADGQHSLASSVHAARLQQAIVDLTRRLYLESATNAEVWAPRYARLFPVLVDASSYPPAEACEQGGYDPRRARLAGRLWRAFEAEPVEDGMDHPAEHVIRATLELGREHGALAWLAEWALDMEEPTFAASVMRCLARQEQPGTVLWRAALIEAALAGESIEIRDAAVQAAESWGEPEIAAVLHGHEEPVGWLRKYIRDVLEDLAE